MYFQTFFLGLVISTTLIQANAIPAAWLGDESLMARQDGQCTPGETDCGFSRNVPILKLPLQDLHIDETKSDADRNL